MIRNSTFDDDKHNLMRSIFNHVSRLITFFLNTFTTYIYRHCNQNNNNIEFRKPLKRNPFFCFILNRLKYEMKKNKKFKYIIYF